MFKFKFIGKMVLALGFIAAVTACSDDDPEPATPQQVKVTVKSDSEAGSYTVKSEKLTFHNVNSAVDTEFDNLNSEITLIPGLYDVVYDAEVSLENGATAHLRANRSSVRIENGENNLSLNAYLNIASDDLVIAEIFFTGTLYNTGNQYAGDDYIKLYNNTDHVIYADGLVIFESTFLTTSKFDYSPDIMNDAVAVDAIYRVPGNGTQYPVQPGEYFLIADNAIDHTATNPLSFNLSHANCEWYDESNNPNFSDIDNPAVPNMDKWYCYTFTTFSLHNRGYKAYGIARLPYNDANEYLTACPYDYTYEMVLPTGTYPMRGSTFKINNSWIVDAVNLCVESIYQWCVTSPKVDSGWAHCGSVDRDPNRYFKSVRRKLLYVTEDGRVVLKDTNNSSADFNNDCIPSEVELQGTAINDEGVKATKVTIDGVTPVEKKESLRRKTRI